MNITDIKGQRNRKHRFSIYIDGKYKFSLDYDTLVRSDLYIGSEIDDASIERLELKDEYARARDYLYSLLSYRDRSEYEARKRLLEKGFNRTVVEEVIDHFKKSGTIDDRRFATAWLDSVLKNRPLGRMRAEYELRAKKVDEKIINEVCEKLLGLEKEAEIARRVCEKRMLILKEYPSEVAKQRLWRYLKNRGFSFDIIQELMKECFCDHIE
jgi:regulatory protein